MLSLEPLLRTRLETITSLKGVHGLADFNAEKTKPTPCAYVVYDGGDVLEDKNDGSEARIATRWLVVLAVKNLMKAADGAPARQEALTIASATLKALMGWRADQAHQPLRLVKLPRPDYAGGLLWLPMVFQTTQILKGN